MTTFVQIITGFFGAFGFALLYNIKGKRLIATAIISFMSWFLFLALGLIISSEAIRYLIVSMIISVYAEILARVLKTPTTTFIITALIPLIPGASLYYTMTSALNGSIETFLKSAKETLTLALGLALGVVIVTAATQLVSRLILVKRSQQTRHRP